MGDNTKIIELTERVKELRLSCTGDLNSLINAYRWNPEHDLRVTSNKRLTRLMIGLNVSFLYLSNSNQEELLAAVRLATEKLDIKHYTLINELFLKVGFVSSLFSIVEGVLRDYLRYLDEEAYKSKKGIMSICNCLIEEKMQWNLFKFDCNVFDFLRLIRNTLHNNGVYHPQGKNDKTLLIRYKENDYIFSEGKRLDFITWDLLLDIANDLRSLLFHISNNETVRSITELVPDTYAF